MQIEARGQGAPAPKMAEYVPRRQMAPRHHAPLSAAELRAMYRRNRSPEIRALLWEIVRLHNIVRRADQLLACFPASACTSTTSALEIVLGALRRKLEGEPWTKTGAGAPKKSGRPGWPHRTRGQSTRDAAPAQQLEMRECPFRYIACCPTDATNDSNQQTRPAQNGPRSREARNQTAVRIWMRGVWLGVLRLRTLRPRLC